MKDRISDDITWKDSSPGGIITEAGNAMEFETGDWRSKKPIWILGKCTQCMLCPPVCPDSSIPVNNEGKREDFDYNHCKGCGVCFKVCPFSAIDFVDEEV